MGDNSPRFSLCLSGLDARRECQESCGLCGNPAKWPGPADEELGPDPGYGPKRGREGGPQGPDVQL